MGKGMYTVGHNIGARGGQQGVRARVRAARKALEGDDRHTDSTQGRI